MHYPPASLPGLSSLLHYRPPPASSLLAAGIAPIPIAAASPPHDAAPASKRRGVAMLLPPGDPAPAAAPAPASAAVPDAFSVLR